MKKNYHLFVSKTLLKIGYIFIVLTCLTFSQKVTSVSQHWPFLYIGIAFIFLGFCYLMFLVYQTRKLHIWGVESLLLYCLMLFVVFLWIVVDPYAKNAFFLNIILLNIFPFIIASLGAADPLYVRNVILAKALCLFGFIQAVIAWFFALGGSFSVLGVKYLHQPLWDDRLHGVMGEPTHFGLLQGVSLISLFYLYRTEITHSVLGIVDKGGYVLLGSFFLISAMASGTRNTFVSLVITFFVYTLLDKKARGIIVNYFIIVLPLLLIAIACYSEKIPDLITYFLKAIRFGDPASENIRINAICRNLGIFFEADIFTIIFGIGFPAARFTPTSFNQYIDILRNYGLVFVIPSLLLIVIILNTYLQKILRGSYAELYALSLMIYSLTVFMFYSAAGNVFHIVTFVFMWSCLTSFQYRRNLTITLRITQKSCCN